MKNKVINFVIKVIIIVLVILVCIFSAYIYSNAKQHNHEVKDKVEEEINYLDVKLTNLINELNSIQLENYKVVITKVQEKESKTDTTEEDKSEEGNKKSNQEEEEGTTSEEGAKITKMEKEQTTQGTEETNWGLIQEETEVFYSVWASILLDLYEIGVEADKIVEFSNSMDQTLMNIKTEDKAKSCEWFAKLYSLLPEFASRSNIEELKKNAIEAKSKIINAYANLETENWEQMMTEIESAENIFVGIMNKIEKEENKSKYNIRKAYILIQELKNSLSTKDKGIFYIKYKNLIGELNTLV